MNQEEPLTVKVVVVGDGSVGKTCILLRYLSKKKKSYTTDKFPVDYIPTVFDNYSSQVQVDSKMVNLSLWDTAGQETYNRLRTLSYGQADVFFIVFSVIEQASFENALEKWLPELEQNDFKSIPKIFVGNKVDMRESQLQQHIKYESAKHIIQEKNCQYFECSALTQEGLKHVFDEGIKVALLQKRLLSRFQSVEVQKNDRQCCQSRQCCQQF